MMIMAPVDASLPSFDLELLRALEALLVTKSPTRAATRLHMTQSSASHALARLREHLGDPLLVRSGRTMVRTARADALLPKLSAALGELGRALREGDAFDPQTSTRVFRLAFPDVLAPVLPALLARLAARAPGVGLEVAQPPRREVPELLSTGALELALTPPVGASGGLRERRLGDVDWAVFSRRGHPALRRGRLTLAQWLAFPHVVVRTGSDSPSFVEEALAATGETRRVGLVVPSFLMAPHVLHETDMLLAAPRQPMLPLADRLGLAHAAPPIAVRTVGVGLVWHERAHADPAHVWLRGETLEVVRAHVRADMSAKQRGRGRGR